MKEGKTDEHCERDGVSEKGERESLFEVDMQIEEIMQIELVHESTWEKPQDLGLPFSVFFFLSLIFSKGKSYVNFVQFLGKQYKQKDIIDKSE